VNWFRRSPRRRDPSPGIPPGWVAITIVVALAWPAGPTGPFGQFPGPGSTQPATSPTSPGATSSPPSRTVGGYLIPDSVDPTGAEDVTSRLQRFVDAAPDGVTIRFAPGGRYRVEGTLLVRQRHGLTFEGGGATLFATQPTSDPERVHWWVDESTDIQIRDLTVEGAHPDPGTHVPDFQWQHAFQIYGGHDIEIGPNVTATGIVGDGVYIARWADGVYVHDCTISWNGRMGIAVVAGRNILVERCTFNNIAYSVFDIEPNDGNVPAEGADAITFRDNVVDGPVFSKFFALGGYGPVSNVVVTGNTVAGARNGIAVDARPRADTPRRSNVIFMDNVAEGVFGDFDAVLAVLEFSNIDGLIIRGNTQAVAPGGIIFARVKDSTGVQIEDNVCPGCAG